MQKTHAYFPCSTASPHIWCCREFCQLIDGSRKHLRMLHINLRQLYFPMLCTLCWLVFFFFIFCLFVLLALSCCVCSLDSFLTAPSFLFELNAIKCEWKCMCNGNNIYIYFAKSKHKSKGDCICNGQLMHCRPII